MKPTGVSLPFGGLQWTDPGPSETQLVRGFITFMEDRRVIYNAMNFEALSEVERSIYGIRQRCTETLETLPSASFASDPIRLIREAGRRFHDDKNEEFRFFDEPWHDRTGTPGFFAALGAFRAIIAYQIARLCGHYGFTAEGELAAVLPSLSDEAD